MLIYLHWLATPLSLLAISSIMPLSCFRRVSTFVSILLNERLTPLVTIERPNSRYIHIPKNGTAVITISQGIFCAALTCVPNILRAINIAINVRSNVMAVEYVFSFIIKNIIQPVCIRTRSPISINLVALFFILDFFSVRIPSPFLHILSIIQSVHHHKSYVIVYYTPILSVLQTVSYIIYNIFPFC